MHWVEVDGFPMPRLVGGHPALDLCNTWAGWGEPWHPKREWIPDFDRLAVWTKHASILDVSSIPRLRRSAKRKENDAKRIVEQVHRLRGALYRYLVDPAGARAWPQIATFVRKSAAVAEFVEGEDELARWIIPEKVGLELPMLSIAQVVGEFLRSPERSRIGRCPGSDCGWLFVDRSGRRKWCSMENCGNRAKVRAYNQRHRRQSARAPE
jgi:predicted RNA-binding Zn ribbon-like protein